MSVQIRKRGHASVLDQFRNEIGVLSNKEIAEKAGCSTANVYMYGRRHGIVGSRPESQPEFPKPFGRGSMLDEYHWMMGRFTDAFISKVAGCTAANVSIYRKKRNIPTATPEVLAETKAAVEAIALAA